MNTPSEESKTQLSKMNDDEDMSNVPVFSDIASLSKYFFNVCRAVRKNRPCATSVAPKRVRGYGRYLGEVLQGNTNVSTLHLYLRPEEVDEPGFEEGVGNIALIVRYLQEGPALRRVYLHSGTLEYVGLCVQAIAQNSHIEWLTISYNAAVPSDEMLSLLTAPESKLEFLSMPIVDDAPIANALANHRALKRLALSCVGPRPSELVFYALHDNTHHLRELSLMMDFRCAQSMMTDVDAALSLYLSCTKTLSTLCLHCQVYDRERTQQLVEGLQSNTSLTELSLSHCSFDAEAVQVLQEFSWTVSSGGPTIKKVTIQSHDMDDNINCKVAPTPAALAALLPIFPALQDLDYGGYFWDAAVEYGAPRRMQ
jgi:hypothetical protein